MARRPSGFGDFDVRTRKWDLCPEMHEFIEWLVTPNKGEDGVPKTQTAFAAHIGVNPNTLAKWKRDTRFITAWYKRLDELNVQPDRVQQVVDALFSKASGDGRESVQAAKLYLEYIDRFTPKRVIETQTSDVQHLSDDELDAIIAEEAERERAARANDGIHTPTGVIVVDG